MKAPLSTRSLTLALVLAACAGAAQAELYKWTDANGVVNYSNLPQNSARGATPIIVDNVSVVQSPRAPIDHPQIESQGAYQQAVLDAAASNAMSTPPGAVEVPRYYGGDEMYYPPRVTYTPTVRRASLRAERNEVGWVPYGIGAPAVATPQQVRFRDLRK